MVDDKDREEQAEEADESTNDEAERGPSSGSEADSAQVTAEDESLGRERARAAARAMGVEDDGDEAALSPDADVEEKKAPANRAERRRALAVKRRKGKGGDDEEAPKDRNARKRQELLDQRRRAAAGLSEEGATAGEPSDVSLAVDDALARSGAAAGRWLKSNWSWLQWCVVLGVVGGAGALAYFWKTGQANAASSDKLAAAVAAEQSRVITPENDKRTDEEKQKADRPVYASYDERAKVALERYQQVAGDKSGSGAALLAKLGIAGTKLDRREWDEAIIGFEEVLRSKLAEADLDVKGRALEGLSFAHEGKKDFDKALATLDQLAEVPEPMFKVTAKYHRARVLLAKGDKEGAKKLLEEARKDIETNELEVKRISGGGMNPYNGLRSAVEQALKRIDPSAVAPRFVPGGTPGGTPQITPEQIRQLLEQKGLQPGLPGRAE